MTDYIASFLHKYHISTHTPLTGRDGYADFQCWEIKISTHTPLTGRDSNMSANIIGSKISTHTPLTGRDGCVPVSVQINPDFYSHAPYGT